MLKQDRITIETAEKKNELESFIYDTRSKLGEIYSSFASQATKDQYLKILSDGEEWLYNDGMRTTKDVYQAKLDEIKNFGAAIVKRYVEFQNLPDVIAAFMNTVDNYNAIVSSNVSRMRKKMFVGNTNFAI